jgi:glyoxylase-like metal-dependent hydrolase (beta-lactamase superfamily II)
MSAISVEVAEPIAGVLRITFRLPIAIEHVHCYLVRGAGGGWMLVDTAIALPGIEPHWESVLASLDGPVEKILVTHFHPDHVGGAALVADLTGAPVFQGRLDFENCKEAWTPELWAEQLPHFLARHGFPEGLGAEARSARSRIASNIRYSPSPVLVDPGDEIDGWEVLGLPGHSPNHLAFTRDGVLVCGDVLLARITPSIPLDLSSGPDPLGRYLDSLGRIAELAPAIALAGHEEVIDDPAARAGQIVRHHEARLERTLESVHGGPHTAFQASLGVFQDDLPPILRLFAFFETLAHLEYLALRDRLERIEKIAGTVEYQLADGRRPVTSGGLGESSSPPSQRA